MIYKTSKNLTFVVYENQRPAKCFEIHKGTIKFLVFIFPFILLAALLVVLFAFTYHKHIMMEGKKEEPKIITDLKSTVGALEKEKAELAIFNKELINKMNQEVSKEISYPFISTPKGAQDLTEKNLAILQDIKFSFDKENRPMIFFNIANNRNEQNRLSGHVSVVLHNGPNMGIYPAPISNSKSEIEPYTFNMAESFSVARFRPVEAKYTVTPLKNYPLFFEIIIFSRSGDLLLRKMLGPYTKEG